MINLNTGDYINWDTIIKNLPEGHGDTIRGKNLLDIDPEENAHQEEIHKEFTECNYLFDGVGWDNYYKKDFIDTSFVDMFAELVGCVERDCSISVVYPGMSAPKHWDIPLLTKLKGYNNLKRYMCFISEPAFGQILIVKDNCYYNQPKGSIIEWDSYLDVHGAANIGTSTFYLFNFTGEPYAGN